jgi:leucyl/phenylalanyl-tRNA--protein transferase
VLQDEKIYFPDPRFSSPEGIVALGGDLTPSSLMSAYRQGIFPWPIEGLPLTWFCPPVRAILRFSDLHVPASLKRELKRREFRFTIDSNFPEVIRSCATIYRPDAGGTWITREMQSAYVRLFELGFAHSVEVWNGTSLVGGIYGVDAGGLFCGESMFHREANASKLGLLFLIEHLKQHGADWIDIQVMSPHMRAFGAVEIPRNQFLNELAITQQRGLCLFPEQR